MNLREIKQARRELKRTKKRRATAEEVIYIFEKILEGWKTIRIYNTMIQQHPTSNIEKKKVETISTGNSKVYETELTPQQYHYYQELRKKVYTYHREKKE